MIKSPDQRLLCRSMACLEVELLIGHQPGNGRQDIEMLAGSVWRAKEQEDELMAAFSEE